MNIAIFGTGMVAQTLALALHAKGHAVTLGTRDVQQARANTQPHPYGMPGFGTWHQAHSHIALATFADAAAGSEFIINATKGAVVLDILQAVPVSAINGKVMLDAANPLDFSHGMPPRVAITDTPGASLAERVQAAHPQLRVVKGLNTLTAALMLNPAGVPGGDSTLFIAGNDAAAKASVVALLQSFGWKDVLDLGDITAARATELLMPLWLRVWGTLGGAGAFNFKVVR
jgi:8-hydroxy-5-deazaflavin:NADPH oxidoreductase